jgi:hypothetical protein
VTAALHYQACWRRLALFGLGLLILLSLLPLAQPVDITHADKWAHWLAWTFVMLWYGSAWPQARLPCLLYLFAVGVLIELLQGLVPWRRMELYDLLANLAGLVTAQLLLLTPLQFLMARVDAHLAQRG